MSNGNNNNNDTDQVAKQLREEVAEREAETESAFEAQKGALSVVVEELLGMAFDDRRRFASMKETLVNHKREVRRHVGEHPPRNGNRGGVGSISLQQ